MPPMSRFIHRSEHESVYQVLLRQWSALLACRRTSQPNFGKVKQPCPATETENARGNTHKQADLVFFAKLDKWLMTPGMPEYKSNVVLSSLQLQ
jgi:hypothetical protein